MVLEDAHQPIEKIYFPETGLTSVVAHLKGERAIEVGIIGFEGMTGVSVVMGDDRSPHETFIQAKGAGSWLSTPKLVAAMAASVTLRAQLLRFAKVFLSQTGQTALSNGRALIEVRLARWILMAHDRLDGDRLELTHEFLALMLGVRRPGVTVGLHLLEGKGLVRARRGTVTVLDREGLEALAGGAYGVPEAEYARLIGSWDPAASATE